jgi:hypothetical protein
MLIVGCGASVASADSSHARIVRLSFVQGDVRFARDVKGDPLADADRSWEAAVLNLPIRQGYVLATDNGRAVVEFENGAMAFLSENTVLEFYDLSSEDGGFTTRLILRQGSAEFYADPARGDYFSVTGGDFSVQAESRTTFRMNNFDDGSNVDVLRGKLTALTKGKSTPLQKNQTLSIKAGDPESVAVETAQPGDDFDQWVSGKIQSSTTATASGTQYANTYDYGLGDLYTYGAWFPVAGYGNCWRPYGVGFGWSPFDSGSWFYDAAFGWSFLGGQPWGWLPYHYGGWLFRPGVGWVWSPSGSFGAGGVGRWRPVTGVWMRSAGGAVGIVPSHPLDVKGKTPLNLSVGLFAVTPRGVSNALPLESSDRWKTQKNPARDIMQSQLPAAAAPARVARTMTAGAVSGARVTTGDGNPAIVYDRTERRFVNAENQPSAKQNIPGVRVAPEQSRSGSATSQVPAASERVSGREGQRGVVPGARNVAPARAAVPPPSVPRSVSTQRVFNDYGGGAASSRGGTNSASGSSSRGASSSTSSAGSAASSGSSGRASSGGSSSSGGGRPH